MRLARYTQLSVLPFSGAQCKFQRCALSTRSQEIGVAFYINARQIAVGDSIINLDLQQLSVSIARAIFRSMQPNSAIAVLQPFTVMDKLALPCRQEIATSEKQKVFAFEKKEISHRLRKQKERP